MKWRSLRNNREFQLVYTEGAKRIGRLLVVYLLAAQDLGRAVVASRKVGGAVQRNRAKRLLREALRQSPMSAQPGLDEIRERFFPDLSGKLKNEAEERGLWVVLVARREILAARSRDVGDELNSLLGADTPGPN